MAGRPVESVNGERRDKTFKMRIEPKFKRDLGKFARRNGCSMAELVRNAVYEYAINHKIL